MIQKHCFECGTELIEKELEGEGIVPYCPACQQFRFPMYNVAVSMIVINEQTGEILLIKQYGRPHFDLVAGYGTDAILGRLDYSLCLILTSILSASSRQRCQLTDELGILTVALANTYAKS